MKKVKPKIKRKIPMNPYTRYKYVVYLDMFRNYDLHVCKECQCILEDCHVIVEKRFTSYGYNAKPCLQKNKHRFCDKCYGDWFSDFHKREQSIPLEYDLKF